MIFVWTEMEAGLRDLAVSLGTKRFKFRQDRKVYCGLRQTVIEKPSQREDKHAAYGFSLLLYSN